MNAIHANALTGVSNPTGVNSRPSRTRLERVVVNTKGATGNVLTIYDGKDNTGNVVAVIDTTTGPVSLHYGINLDNGLTYTLLNGSPADVTIIT